jgi:hypothetical protein
LRNCLKVFEDKLFMWIFMLGRILIIVVLK